MSARIVRAPVLGAFLALSLWSFEKPNLNGTWELKTGVSELPSAKGANLTWIIVQDDSKIRISEVALYSDGKEKKTEINCTTDGKECEADAKGQPRKVSFWYNGPILVEMDFTGKNREAVVRKRMTVTGDGRQMHVELMPLVGSGEDSGHLVFEKQ